VQQISGGRVRLRAGTLYTAPDRLRADGLVGVDREEVVEGRLRRYYRLIPEGTGRLPVAATTFAGRGSALTGSPAVAAGPSRRTQAVAPTVYRVPPSRSIRNPTVTLCAAQNLSAVW
jgi:Transcriptional regulator PadR-like family